MRGVSIDTDSKSDATSANSCCMFSCYPGSSARLGCISAASEVAVAASCAFAAFSRSRVFSARKIDRDHRVCASCRSARIYIVSLRRKARGCHGSPTEHVLGGVRAHHAPLGSVWARTQPSRARRGHGHEAAVAPRSAALSREKADQRCAADGAERVTQAVARTVSGAYSPHAMSCDRCCARSEAARRRPL